MRELVYTSGHRDYKVMRTDQAKLESREPAHVCPASESDYGCEERSVRPRLVGQHRDEQHLSSNAFGARFGAGCSLRGFVDILFSFIGRPVENDSDRR